MSVPTSSLIYVKPDSKDQKIVDAVIKRYPDYTDFCTAVGIELDESCKPERRVLKLKNGLDGFEPHQWEKLMKIWHNIPLYQRNLYLQGVI